MAHSPRLARLTGRYSDISSTPGPRGTR